MRPTAAFASVMLLLVLSLPPAAAAEQATSRDIRVSGFTGETLYAHMTIDRQKADEIVLRWTSFPDRTPGSTRAIESPMVTISPQEPVAGGTRQTFGITISSVKEAGRYEGDIEIYDKNGRAYDPRHLSIDVRRAPAYAAVAPAANTTPQLVKCSGYVDRWLAETLLRHPPSTSIPDFATVKATNVPPGTRLTPGEIVARGVNTLLPLRRDAVIPGTAARKADLLVVPATVVLGVIEPDQYTGSMLVSVDGQPEPISVPIAFSVRNGPLIPALLLVVGLFIAWLAQWIDTKGQPQIDFLRRADRVVYGLTPADAALLGQQIADARASALRFDLTAADAAMKQIENRATLLVQLERLEAEAQALGSPVADAIVVAREAIRVEDDTTAAAKIQEIRNALYEAAKNARTARGIAAGPKPSALEMHADRLADAAARLVPAPRPPMWRRGRASFSAWLAEARANVVRRVLRPLFFILVVILLLAGGLYTLWIKNPSFGASPLADYLSVVTWGMGANIATKTLASLHSLFGQP